MVLSSVLFTLACAPSEPPVPVVRGVARITAEQLEEDVRFLASDDFNGRETGTPELARAAEHLASRFAEAGWSPLTGDDDRFHQYTLYRRGWDREQTRLSIVADGEA